jgi:hypothetical protein
MLTLLFASLEIDPRLTETDESSTSICMLSSLNFMVQIGAYFVFYVKSYDALCHIYLIEALIDTCFDHF